MLLVSSSLAQTSDPISFWVSAGFGPSSYGYGQSHWSKSGNVSVGVSFDKFLIKYVRRVNSEFSIGDFENQTKSHEILFGYSIPLKSSLTRFYITVGIGELIESNQLSTHSGLLIPIECEWLFCYRFFGVSLTTFVQVSRFQPIIGGHLNFMFGVF